MTDFELDFDDLSTDAVLAQVGEKHDGAAKRLDELRAYEATAEAADEAAEELDLEETESLPKKVGLLTDELEDLRQYRDERESEEMKEHAEVIAERTDRFGEDPEDVLEEHEDLADIKETRELVESLTEPETEERTANADAGTGTERREPLTASPWD